VKNFIILIKRLDKYFYRNDLCWKFIQFSTNNKNDRFAFDQMMYYCEKARDKLGKLKHQLDKKVKCSSVE
jgi:hypothetical protein